MSPIQDLQSRLLDDDAKEGVYDVTKGEQKNFSPDDSYERSTALERVYVHEVYENCENYNTSTTVRSKVVQFLNNLDPGSVICDVGCGNGRYLTPSCNPSIFAIGVERSFRLAKAAKNSSLEVALCDNLELPFRDESFDAVLSLSVIHHFSTTERRISAIRELARILKVGGKIVISVWAFEQKSRRFDGNSSQDVLIPWQSSQIKNTANSDDDEDEDFLAPYHAYNYNEDSIHSNSSRSIGDGDSSSISSSSSPNDTCYSFVRRALQKLAGGKKSPWFLDSWTSREMQKENSLETKDEEAMDAKDLPIELRRLDDYAGVKSRSLGSILCPPQKQIVRSLSSVPSLGGTTRKNSTEIVDEKPTIDSSKEHTVKKNIRPKLMKQKQSITDEESLMYHCDDIRSQFLRKQSSLNEELMAESRIREKERIRKKIQKQVSLNESFLYRSLLTKRLQVIREGFTTKFKKSTGSLERLTKNGFVKVIKNIKNINPTSNPNKYSFNSSESKEPIFTENVLHSKCSQNLCNDNTSQNIIKHTEPFGKIRRESGSDSSKDSSIDTSIESEDSFASVIDCHTHNPRNSLVATSPLALSVQSPPTSKVQQNYQIDPIKFSFDLRSEDKAVSTSLDIKEESFESATKNDTTRIKSKENEIEIQSSKDFQSLKFPSAKDLPEIPKFRKKTNHFPFVKRLPSASSSKIIVPKLVSLDIFNPEIDDSSSEGEEEGEEEEDLSSPDSVDSVINKTVSQTPAEDSKSNNEETGSIDNGAQQKNENESISPPLLEKIQTHLSQNILASLPGNSCQISKRQQIQKQQQQKVNDFILEENEETDDDEEDNAKSMQTIDYQSSFKNSEYINDTTCLLQEESFEENELDTSQHVPRPLLKNLKSNSMRPKESFESYNHSLENSNSTTASLDSPSFGGSATHHVFHHIFRQNELDDLINKHVNNLHIVSSFYEKQSWCVVCEKVQVWTI